MGPWLRAAGLVLGSTLLFKALQRGLRRLPLPAQVCRDPTRAWRWRNLLVSFVHSVVTGLWAVLCVWQVPDMLMDIENVSSTSGYLLLCFSAGYFIHDTLDIIVSHQSRASWEYLVHHAMASVLSRVGMQKPEPAKWGSQQDTRVIPWGVKLEVVKRAQGTCPPPMHRKIGDLSVLLRDLPGPLRGSGDTVALRGGEQHLPDHPHAAEAEQHASSHPLQDQQVRQPGDVFPLPPGAPDLPDLVLCALRGGAGSGSLPDSQPLPAGCHDPDVLLPPAALRLLPRLLQAARREGRGRGEVLSGLSEGAAPVGLCRPPPCSGGLGPGALCTSSALHHMCLIAELHRHRALQSLHEACALWRDGLSCPALLPGAGVPAGKAGGERWSWLGKRVYLPCCDGMLHALNTCLFPSFCSTSGPSFPGAERTLGWEGSSLLQTLRGKSHQGRDSSGCKGHGELGQRALRRGRWDTQVLGACRVKVLGVASASH